MRLYDLTNCLSYVALRSHTAQRNTDAGACPFSRQADGLKNVGRFYSPSIAGCTSTHHQTWHAQQEGIGFEPLEGEMSGIGKAWCTSSSYLQMGDRFQQAMLQLDLVGTQANRIQREFLGSYRARHTKADCVKSA